MFRDPVWSSSQSPEARRTVSFPCVVLILLATSSLLAGVLGAATSQDPIPNGSFEDWGERSPKNFGAFQPPMGFFQTVFPSDEARFGNRSARLQTIGFFGQTFSGGMFYCQGACSSERDLEFPVTRQADAICGHYKASLLGGDRLMVNLVYRHGGRPFAGTDQGDSQHAFLAADASEWTPFRVPITAAPGDEETIPDRALLQIALFGPGYPQQPADFGTAGSQAWVDGVRFCDDVVDLEVDRPGVLGGATVDDSSEASPGVQTFVNLDNDDGDDFFDHDPDPSLADSEVMGDDELVPLRLRLEPLMGRETIARLEIEGGEHIELWKTAAKKERFDADRDLQVPGDDVKADDDGYWLDLWVEGIEPQGPLQETSLHLTWEALPEMDDLVSLAVLGVEKIELRGEGNGLSDSTAPVAAPRHDSDTLDADPNFPTGTGIEALRVFSGARIDNIDAARDKVHVDVTLSRAPVESFDLYLRAFDLDDPSDSGILDPNDGGCGSNQGCGYDGTDGLTYTAEEDNRTKDNKAGGFEEMDVQTITKLEFDAGQQMQSVSFRVSQQPGDSYRLVANADEDFLAELRNLDAEDGLEIVDPRIQLPLPEERAIRQPDFYASPVLTVWRLLHVEADSMAKVDRDANTVRGEIEKAMASSGASRAETVGLSVNLTRDLSDDSWTLEKGDNGRFENGTLWVGKAKVPTFPLKGNGQDYVRGPGSGIDVPFILQPGPSPSPSTGPPPSTLVGWVQRFEGTVFDLEVAGNDLPGSAYANGTLNVAGTEMKVARVVDTPNAVVEVTQALPIPFELVDDDDMDLLPQRPNLDTTITAFEKAYVLAVDDGGGNPSWNSDSVPFQLNLPPGDQAILDTLNDHRQSTEESASFWVVYVLSGFQYVPWAKSGDPKELDKGDEDPLNSEAGVTGFTLWEPGGGPTVAADSVATGGEASIFFVETERDVYSQDPSTVSRDHAENVAHEIGHQFGLFHRPATPSPDDVFDPESGWLMHPQLHGRPEFQDQSIYYIRGRIESPGRSKPNP